MTGNSPLQGGHREDSLEPCLGEWHKGTQGHQQWEKETSGLSLFLPKAGNAVFSVHKRGEIIERNRGKSVCSSM